MSDSFLPLLALGVACGATTVLFGFGGGFVIVPAVVVLGAEGDDPMHVAVATSAAVILVNASVAALTQWRRGRLRRAYLWPLAGFVALGAATGSLAANALDGAVLHGLFLGYLLMTILDSLLRAGFLVRPEDSRPRPLSRGAVTLGGTGIGVVAAGLGVGGSVLTVPLLRRRGLPMAEATAMANPLSVPVAAVATTVYALAPTAAAAGGRLGHVDLPAAAALLAGSLPTIAVVGRVAGRVPDRVHAAAHVGLLVLVLVVTAVVGP
ncbi:sulfite exporter TauE/SafE family protein [Streptomyces sp. NPDC059853]|uniref:sulfite exporter TauE/SafE family protein n=1 Tax=Streptomyces sp. NPDC059853 TaxID=3346973 RepID=UPI0036538F46